jgi:hypothetical protein
MVQTEDQYLFIHQTILDELNENPPCLPSTMMRTHILEQMNTPSTTPSSHHTSWKKRINLTHSLNETSIISKQDHHHINHTKDVHSDNDDDNNDNDFDKERAVHSEPMEVSPPPPTSPTSLPPSSSSTSTTTPFTSMIRRIPHSESDIYHRSLKLRRSRYITSSLSHPLPLPIKRFLFISQHQQQQQQHFFFNILLSFQTKLCV